MNSSMHHPMKQVILESKNLEENEQRNPTFVDVEQDRDIKLSTRKMHNKLK